MHRRFTSVLRLSFMVILIGGLLLQAQGSVHAATSLSVTPITWNVIGLDSNNVNVGPNHFPIGARACNTSTAGETLTNVTATLNWDSLNNYIDRRPGTNSSLSVASLTAGSCTDFYFEVEVDRDAAAYDTTREYHISVTANGGTVSASTPTPRVLYVEHLISQNRNTVSDMRFGTSLGSLTSVPNGGTMTLMVGSTYYIQLVGATATQGYEQIESFINFPNTIFQVLSVETTYTSESSTTLNPPYDKLYGDACSWENDPSSANYRACLSTGKAGGNITVTYQVRILQVPAAPLVNPEPLSTLIYDFSGSSFHYNSDYGTSTRYAYIVSPATISKAFSPNTISANGTSTLTFTISNTGTSTLSNVNFADTTPGWPSGMAVASTTVTNNGNCGSPTPSSLTVGAQSASFSNITLAAGATCTISISVTAPADGSYTNTTQNLFIDTLDTGNKASATLLVSSLPNPPTSCGTATTDLATWSFENYTASTSTNNGPFTYSSKQTNVSSASAIYGAGGGGPGSSSAIVNSATFPAGWNAPDADNTTTSWGISNGWPTTGVVPTGAILPYFQFQVDASQYGGLGFIGSYNMDGNWSNGDNWYVLFSTNGTTWNSINTAAWNKQNGWKTDAITAAPTAGTGYGTVYFRVIFVGAQYTGGGAGSSTAVAFLDNIRITGCARPTPPTLSKSFSPTSIGSDSTDPTTSTSINYSTLTFTIGNTNTTALTGVSFTDTLPDGLVVASPPSVSAFSCNAGTMTGTVTATAGSSTISLSSGSLPAGTTTTCSFSVRVQGTVVGSYMNTSNRITATSSGANTSGGANVGYGQSSLTVVGAPVISKAFGANTLLTGNSTTLTFTLYNPNASTALTGVGFTVADSLGAQLQVSSPNGLTGPMCTSGTLGGTITALEGASSVNFTGGSINAGATCTFSINVTATATTGLKTNSVTVTSANGGTGNTSTANILVKNPVVDLRLSKTVGLTNNIDGTWSSDIVTTASTPLYYRIVAENIGDVDFTSVTVNDPTLAAALGVSNPISCTWYQIDPTDTVPPYSYITTTTLPAASASADPIAYCILGPVPAATGTVTNTALAHGVTASSGSTDSETDSATYTALAPNLELTKINGVTSVTAGSTTTYTLTVANSGNIASSGMITVMDVLPTGLSIPDGAITEGGTNAADWTCTSVSNVISCTSSTAIAASGGTSVFSFDVNVDATASGTLLNRAQVGGGGDPTNSSTPTITTVGQCTGTNTPNEGCVTDSDTVNFVNLGLIKTDGTTNVIAGTTTTYSLTVTNSGNIPTSGTITVVDVLPTGLSIANGGVTLGGTQAANWACTASSNVITCTSNIAIAGNGGTSVFNFTVDVAANATGTLINKAQVGGGGDPTNPNPPTSTTVGQCTGTNTPNEGCRTDTNTAIPQSDVGITKSDGVFSYVPGAGLTYTVTVINNGPSDAIGVIVFDTKPSQITTWAWACTSQNGGASGCTPAASSSSDFSDSVDIPNGGNIVYTVTANTDSAATGNLINTANVQLTIGADPVPGNQASTDLDEPTPQADLEITKDDGSVTYVPGGGVIYTVSVTNNGPSDIVDINQDSTLDVAISDTKPSQITTWAWACTSQIGGAVGCTPAASSSSNFSDSVGIPSGGSIVYTVTANIDPTATGNLVNTATVSVPVGVTDPTPGNNSSTDTDTVSVVNLGLAKTNGTTTVTAGGTTTYTLTVTNSGNLATSEPIRVVDVLPTGLSIADGSVALGGAQAANWSCSAASNVITCNSNTTIEASGGTDTSVFSFIINVDANASGTVINKAQVGGGGDPTNPNLPTGTTAGQCTGTNTPNEGCSTDSDTVNTQSITIIKDAVPNDPQDFSFTGSGPSGFTFGGGFSLDDDVDATLPNTRTFNNLVPGNYSLMESNLIFLNWSLTGLVCTDPDSGSSTNFGIASIDLDAGEEITCTFTNTFNGTPELSILKTLDSNIDEDNSGTVSLNDTLTYSVTVTNIGSTTLTNVEVSDTLITPSSTTCASVAPGATCMLTGTYVVTQADVDNGQIVNTGSVTDDDVCPNAGPAVCEDPNIQSVSQTPAIVLTKTAALDTTVVAPGGVVNAGDTITYTFSVQNTGNVTITNITVTDPLLPTLTCTITSLAPGASAGCSATNNVYSLTQADINAGSRANTATATGKDPNNNDVIDPDTKTVTLIQSASIVLTKTPTLDDTVVAPSGVANAGDTITYSFSVQNTGNVTITNIVVTDPLLQTLSCTIASLTPGANTSCTATNNVYALTQADIDSGSRANTATATGKDPLNNDVADPDTKTVTLIQAPSIVLTKTPSLDDTVVAPSGVVNVGDTITYTFSVQNTGNVTISNIVVTDPLLPSLSCTIASLAPGATSSCAATNNVYTLTQADINAGSRANTATATGKDPNNNDVPDTDTNTTTLPQVASILLTKTANPTSVSGAGDVITYAFSVQNTGNVTLTNVTISDALLSSLNCTTIASLPAGATQVVTCTENTYTVTQADIDNNGGGDGDIDNTATATGTPPSGGSVSDTDSQAVTLPTQNPALTTTKVLSSNADEDTSGTVSVNDTLTYSITVTNTGNTTLTSVVVSDTLITPNMTTCASLSPNNTCVLTGTYVVTQADVDNSQIINTGSVADDDVCPAAGIATCNSTVTTTLDEPVIGISKRVVSTTEVSAGTWDVTYEIRVENFGNIVLDNVQVLDDLTTTFPSPTTFTVQSLTSTAFAENTNYNGDTDMDMLTGGDSLAVGASGTITLVVRVVPASAGPFNNIAIASGQCPICNSPVTDISQNGIDPDPDGDNDPTNNNVPTSVDFGPNLFDPPFGLKVLDASGLPVLQWTMVWINNSNIVAVNAQVSDPIVAGTTFVAGSLTCTPSGVTTTTSCTYDAGTNRIIWIGNLGADLGATDAASANNEITITFRVNVAAGITGVQNVATIDSDLNGNQTVTDPGEQQVASASARWTASTSAAVLPALPDTGFAPNVISDLRNVPNETYVATNGVTIEIPSLGVNIPVVGVPKKKGTWNVAWLGKQAGWLEGSSFPSWKGNSVLTGHVYLANGLPGPFVNLNKLKYGDRIIVHAYGQTYIFEVRTNDVVAPNDKSVLKHEDSPWLTLITCKDYDEKTNTYKKRLAVRAVLIKVTEE